MTVQRNFTAVTFACLAASLLAFLVLGGCGDGFPSQEKGEALTERYVKAYFSGDFDKVTNMLPHEERTSGNLTLAKGFMERNKEKVEKLGGLKTVRAENTRVLTNTEKGPTEISVSYSLEFKESASKGTVRLEARMIDGKWYVTSSNFFPMIPSG